MAAQAYTLDEAFQMVCDRLHVVEAKEQSLRAVLTLLLNLHPDKLLILDSASTAVREAAKELDQGQGRKDEFLDLVLHQINAMRSDADETGQVVPFPGGPNRP